MKKIEIWTDGGYRSSVDLGAWAVVMKYGDYQKELSGAEYSTTNNKMEMTAIIEALKALKKTDIPVTIYSDSAYCVNGITSWVYGWVKKGWKKADKKPVENRELWEEMISLRDRQENLEFIRVKGHADNEGNNLADLLVNKAMDEELDGVR